MASFTDTVPQFNPYVQQLPVEAMVKVGMEKQRRYDEGITKIQGYIDNIAGLDIIRGVDRDYLQSKLNELGNRLTTVAAGDFSNYQLVNSVSGMATQIVKDKNVQTAVGSTAWYRKQAALMEDAIKEGKSSQANIFDFNQKVNKYMLSTDLNESFSDRYTPYTDVNKKWLETLKTLHPQLSQYDLPYEQNPDGSINYSKIAAAMSRISKETVSVAQIENAIRSSLTPDDLNQLGIDARYQFRDKKVEDLQKYAIDKYKASVETVDKKIEQLQNYAKVSTSNSKEYNSAIKTIDDLREYKKTLEENSKIELEYITNNPDAAKAEIYKNGAISQFANAFAWENNKKELLSNPVLEAEHWEREQALRQSTFNLSVRAQNWKEKVDQHNMDLADNEYALKLKQAQEELYGASGAFHTYYGENTTIKDPESALNEDIASKISSAESAVNDIAKSMGVPKSTVESNLSSYARGDVSQIPVEWREAADKILSDRKEAKRLDGLLKKVDQDIENDATTKANNEAINKELASLPTLKIGNYTYTQREILDYLNKQNVESISTIGGSTMFGSLKIFYGKLTPKEKALRDATIGPTGVPGGIGASNLPMKFINWLITKSPTEEEEKADQAKSALATTVNGVLSKYKSVEEKNRANILDIRNRKTAKLKELTGKYIPVASNITVTDKSRNYMEGIASAALARYKTDKGGAEDLDVEGAQGMVSDKDRAANQYRKVIQGDKVYLSVSRGSTEHLIPLTDLEASQLPRLQNEPTPFQRRVTAAQQMNNGSTDIPSTDNINFEPNNPSNAMFTAVDFRNVKKLRVHGNLQWNQSNHSMNYLTLTIGYPYKPRTIKLDNNPMDADQAADFVSKLTDTHIVQLFLSDPTMKNDQDLNRMFKAEGLIK